jgi:hypothetical protein
MRRPSKKAPPKEQKFLPGSIAGCVATVTDKDIFFNFGVHRIERSGGPVPFAADQEIEVRFAIVTNALRRPAISGTR